MLLRENPVYLGHIIFMLGLALPLHSLLAAILAVVIGISFHRRILKDEKRLAPFLASSSLPTNPA